MIVIDLDINKMIEDIVSDPETYLFTSFGLARIIIQTDNPKMSEDEINDAAVELVFKFILESITSNPIEVMKMREKFYESSKKFFARKGVD